MEIKTKYDFKQMVYLVHDADQQSRMVTGIRIVTPKLIMYELSCGSEKDDYYEYEISAEKDQVLALTSKKEKE